MTVRELIDLLSAVPDLDAEVAVENIRNGPEYAPVDRVCIDIVKYSDPDYGRPGELESDYPEGTVLIVVNL